jgi:methionyl-tRNA synthetase
MKNEIETTTETVTANPTPTAPLLDISPTIKFEDFAKIDLRVARIVSAEHVPDAEKLLKLIVDIGDGKNRQIFAGIKSAFEPSDLEGKLTVIVANLEPRKMRFGMSEGMVIVASGEAGAETGLFLLEPQSGATPGMRVK